MLKLKNLLAIVGLSSLLAACAGVVALSTSGGGAPQPLKKIDLARFYTGTWLEIGRRPMFITDGCVAGTTTYRRTADPTMIEVKDACREGTRAGREKSIGGPGTILDPGFNAKLRVRYNAFISREYWIIDRAADYSWFIEASPDFQDLYIFTRRVPSEAKRKALVARAAALGYDTRKLEFPPQPPQ